MKLKIKTVHQPLKRFTMGKVYEVIDTWSTPIKRIPYPVVKDDKGFRCMIKLKDCNHIHGDWEVIEGSIEDLIN